MSQNDPDDCLRIIARTHVGMVRTNNEDAHGYSPNILNRDWLFYDQSNVAPEYPPVLLALADGMGGLEMGEEASRIAIETTRDFVFRHAVELVNQAEIRDELFVALFQQINHDILSFAKQQGKAGAIGTTLVIAFLCRGLLQVYWIGDSRCYLFREGKLTPVSKDHSYVQELVDGGKITYEQAFFHPESHIITQYMGDPGHTPVASVASVTMQAGDLVLMCSDGLNSMIQDVDIEDHLKKDAGLDTTCKTLIDQANAAGGNDNITVMMLSIGMVPSISAGANGDSLVQTIRYTGHDGTAPLQDAVIQPHRKRRGFLGWMMVLLFATLLVFYVGYLKCNPENSAPGSQHEAVETDSMDLKNETQSTLNR